MKLMATLLMFLAMPLVLGSWAAFSVTLIYPAAIAARIINEEKVLEAGLGGYSDYKKRVKYRLIPYIWRSWRRNITPPFVIFSPHLHGNIAIFLRMHYN